jgi:hypothetical protein
MLRIPQDNVYRHAYLRYLQMTPLTDVCKFVQLILTTMELIIFVLIIVQIIHTETILLDFV